MVVPYNLRKLYKRPINHGMTRSLIQLTLSNEGIAMWDLGVLGDPEGDRQNIKTSVHHALYAEVRNIFKELVRTSMVQTTVMLDSGAQPSIIDTESLEKLGVDCRGRSGRVHGVVPFQ